MDARTVVVDAKPDALTIDVSKTAIIVVDMQNHFGAKGGMFDRAGLDLSGIQAAVGPISQVIAEARERGDEPLTELRFRCSRCGTDRTDFVVTSRDNPQPW